MIGIAEWPKAGKQGSNDSINIKQFSIQPSTIFKSQIRTKGVVH